MFAYRVISISSCAQSHPSSIAMRYLQRKAIMTDPSWQNGHYYATDLYPKMGMKLARLVHYLYDSIRLELSASQWCSWMPHEILTIIWIARGAKIKNAIHMDFAVPYALWPQIRFPSQQILVCWRQEPVSIEGNAKLLPLRFSYLASKLTFRFTMWAEL